MDELVRWLGEQLDLEEQQAFAAGSTLRGEMVLRWRAAGSGVEVDGRRKPVNEPLVVTNRYMEDMPGYEVERARALHIAGHDPNRVMGEVDAKRKLVDLHAAVPDHGRFSGSDDCETFTCDGDHPDSPVCRSCRTYAGDPMSAPCPTLRLLALPYADRPGYREEWRP
ncbi:DUF6221 family protein [Streptomyces fumanus]|uniref:Uncharacterized protein n=1 Tax=Streptomyces fumanus TaxID=67302 RepID=A0A919DWF8_9ACTN|nr:DUF6221 family protein [Streptomyces fumanus]GHE84939.1 hypothetical protein GCM10018772_05090 [Streptomyces fumanus]